MRNEDNAAGDSIPAPAGTSVAATPPPQADITGTSTVINTRNAYFTFILVLLGIRFRGSQTAPNENCIRAITAAMQLLQHVSDSFRKRTY